jgi:hypothetical protein
MALTELYKDQGSRGKMIHEKFRSKQSCETVPLMSLSSVLFCSGLVVIKTKTAGSKVLSPLLRFLDL